MIQDFTAKLFQYMGIGLLMLKGFVPIFTLNFTNLKLLYGSEEKIITEHYTACDYFQTYYF